jgi:MFS transporter, DHA1 family, tetracycline resistance protein
VLIACLAAFSIDFFVAAFAPTILWLFAARLIAGITGASQTVAYAYLADITDAKDRAARFGLLGVAFGLGFIIGPALGGVLAGIDHRLPFMVAGGLAALNAVAALFALPESLPQDRRRAFSWRRANPLGAARQVLALGGPLAWMAAGLFAWFIGFQALQGLWSFYASWRFGWGPIQVGLSLTAVGVGSVLVQGFVIKRAVARFGERATATVGMICGAIAFVLYGVASVPWIGMVGIVFGSVSGLAYPSIQALMSGAAPDNAQGELQGAISAISSIAVIVGPPLMTGLFAYVTAPGTPLPVPGLPYFLASALALATLALVRRGLRTAQ